MLETSLLLAPGEVSHLELTCYECQEVCMFRTHGDKDVPSQCPHCGTSWLSGEEGNSAKKLMDALRKVNDDREKKYSLELRAPCRE